MTLSDVWRGMMTPADKILLSLLLILSVGSYLIVKSVFPSDPGRVAIVEIKGREVKRLSLNPLLPSRKVSASFDGGEAIFEIDKGGIRLTPLADSLCSKHICSRKGWIDKPWDMIVCLPNKIVVRVLAVQASDDIDLISR